MHTVELLEQALSVARQLGYGIRHEWLGGRGGGSCEINGKKWLFVDLALNSIEQLEQVGAALQADAGIYTVDLTPELREMLDIRRSA